MKKSKPQERIDELNCDLIPKLKNSIKEQQRLLAKYEEESKNISLLFKKKDEAPTVSDHAVLRYIERALGVNVEAIRLTIMTPVNSAAIEAGATSIKVNGVDFKVKNKTIVTAIA